MEQYSSASHETMLFILSHCLRQAKKLSAEGEEVCDLKSMLSNYVPLLLFFPNSL
jgi:hypothetical protein